MYPKEIEELIRSIPKEHRKGIQKIIEFYYAQGVKDMQELIKSAAELPPDKITEYGVYHNSDLDGG